VIDPLILIGTGVCLFICLRWIRKGDLQRWHSFAWSVWFSVGLMMHWEIKFAPLFALLIPLAVRLTTKSWFQQSISWSGVLSSVLLTAIVAAIYQFILPQWWFLLGYLMIESVPTWRLIRYSFGRRGISWISSSGRSVLWFKWYYFTSLAFVLVTVAMPLTDGQQWSVLSIQAFFLLVSFSALIRFSGKEAFDPIFQAAKYQKSIMDKADQFRILTALRAEITKAKYHLKAEASLAGLSQKVNASTHQVSQVINESEHMTFFEYLAYHRVQEAKKLLKSESFGHYKIEQIAEEVGYLSKSSFNTSFRKITGLTPSEYRDRNVREAKLERLEQREFRTDHQSESTFEYIKNSTTMFSNFIKVYLRNLSKNWLFSVINISGLCIGFISAILIYLYISHELSYDRFHNGYENIYRITLQSDNPQTRTPHPMAGQLVADFPQVESAVTLTPLYGPGLTLQSIYLRNPENNILLRVPDGYAADTSFFSVFDFELLAGNPKTALDDVGSVVISESLAKQFFGDDDPMGKRVEGAADGGFGIVTGVMKDAPSNSHFHPQFIMSYNTLRSDSGNDLWMSWGDPGHFNYIRLNEDANAGELESVIPKWVEGYGANMPRELLDAIRNSDISFGLQPIADIHLNSDLRWELEPNSSHTYTYILMGAMVFILVIITVNFINLYAARSYERSKEVGIRKTLGASTSQLNLQFVGESFFTGLLAMMIALGAAAMLLPYFNGLSGKSLPWHSLIASDVLVGAFVAIFFIGTFGGLLASGSLSRGSATNILKGMLKGGDSNRAKRSVLLGLQFVVSAIMIFGSVVILEQVNFLENRPIGIGADELVIMELHSDEEVRSLEAIKAEMLQHPGIEAVGGISNLPGGQFNRNDLFIEDTPENRVAASELWVDFDALQVLDLSLKSGRWFDPSVQLDSIGTNFIINESAFDRLSLNNTGELISWAAESGPVKGSVVGVLNDFNYKSLHEPIRPLIVMVGLRSINYLLIRINGQNVPETLDWIDRVHGQFDSEFVTDYWFMDDQLNRLYSAERNAFSIFNLFAGIASFLAAMGLLGTAYLTITQRKKEIGIRKVLGARLDQLLILENKPFIIVVFGALAIGLPIGVLAMGEWLSEFAYHISIGAEPFFWTSVILILVALTSVSVAVLRTVLQNPSEALRTE